MTTGPPRVVGCRLLDTTRGGLDRGGRALRAKFWRYEASAIYVHSLGMRDRDDPDLADLALTAVVFAMYAPVWLMKKLRGRI